MEFLSSFWGAVTTAWNAAPKAFAAVANAFVTTWSYFAATVLKNPLTWIALVTSSIMSGNWLAVLPSPADMVKVGCGLFIGAIDAIISRFPAAISGPWATLRDDHLGANGTLGMIAKFIYYVLDPFLPIPLILAVMSFCLLWFVGMLALHLILVILKSFVGGGH